MDQPGFDSATLLAFARYHTRTTWQKVQHDLKQPLPPKNTPPEIVQYEAAKPTITDSELATYNAYGAYNKRFEVPDTVVGSNFFAGLIGLSVALSDHLDRLNGKLFFCNKSLVLLDIALLRFSYYDLHNHSVALLLYYYFFFRKKKG
jgi:hypothetical protein